MRRLCTSPILTLILLSFASMAWTSSAFSADSGSGDTGEEVYNKVIRIGLTAIGQLGRECPTCGLTDSDSLGPSPACRATYADLYKKDTVDMRVIFGYLDDGAGGTDDGYMASALTERLSRPCSAPAGVKQDQMCGFTQPNPDAQPEVWQKFMPGPDGRQKTIRLTVARSSETNKAALNRKGSGSTPAQKARTERVQQLSDEGACQADVQIEAGHARKGGGPDFGPPVVLLDGKGNPTNHVNYDWYQKHKPGISDLTSALAKCSTPPKILALFGCNAEHLFKQELRGAAPSSGLILASGELDYFQTVFAQTVGTLDAALNMRCEDGFNRSVNVYTDNAKKFNYNYGEPATLHGVFKDIPFDSNAPANMSSSTDPALAPPASGLGGAQSQAPPVVAPVLKAPPLARSTSTRTASTKHIYFSSLLESFKIVCTSSWLLTGLARWQS